GGWGRGAGGGPWAGAGRGAAAGFVFGAGEPASCVSAGCGVGDERNMPSRRSVRLPPSEDVLREALPVASLGVASASAIEPSAVRGGLTLLPIDAGAAVPEVTRTRPSASICSRVFRLVRKLPSIPPAEPARDRG